MPEIGIVIIDTYNYALANNALLNSIAKIAPAHVLAFTDNPYIWNEYDKKIIPKINSIDDYNDIVLTQVSEYVYLEHYLFIQYDGFVINEMNFDRTFLEYDYIGAHWPQYATRSVGNGGFSLRSKKLIQAAAELAHCRKGFQAEDLFICREIASVLEDKFSIKFAPTPVADKFSFEAPFTNRNTFGFHGLLNLPIVYNENLEYLFSNLTNKIIHERKSELLYGLIQSNTNEAREYIRILTS